MTEAVNPEPCRPIHDRQANDNRYWRPKLWKVIGKLYRRKLPTARSDEQRGNNDWIHTTT